MASGRLAFFGSPQPFPPRPARASDPQAGEAESGIEKSASPRKTEFSAAPAHGGATSESDRPPAAGPGSDLPAAGHWLPAGLPRGFPPSPPKLNLITPHQTCVADVAMAHPEMSEGQIAKHLGGSSRDASHIHRVLEKPQVRVYMAGFLDEAGATCQESARVVAEAHNANEVKVFNNKGVVVKVGKDGQTELRGGGVIYSKPLVDHQTRLRAAELNVRVRGLMTDPQQSGIADVFERLKDNELALISIGKAKVSDFVFKGGAR